MLLPVITEGISDKIDDLKKDSDDKPLSLEPERETRKKEEK